MWIKVDSEVLGKNLKMMSAIDRENMSQRSKFNLNGRVALVTGAAGGMGTAIIQNLAELGADIVASDVCKKMPTILYESGTEKRLNDLVGKIKDMNRRAIGIKADVSKSADVQAMVDSAIREFGRIDILVNNAGILNFIRIVDMPEEVWDEMIAVHLRGAFLCCKYVGRYMMKQKYGRIINISSVGGLRGVSGLDTHYVAAKHGLIGLTRGLALEMGEYNVTVNAICPGLTRTPMVEEGIDKHYSEMRFPVNPVTWSVFPDYPRLHPQDIADAVAWLASDAATHITGIALPVDAGFTAH